MNAGETSAAWPWAAKTTKSLATINSVSYSTEDFKHWWSNWKEPGMKFPEDLQGFIEWKLLAQEAAIMELDQEPTYRHKMEVFLKARSRMFLKYDEVDSRIQISEQEVKARYTADYTPIWYVTVLYFATAEAANKGYDYVAGGTYTFDELRRLPVKEGGPQQDREARLRPNSVKDNNLLSAIRDLAPGEVSRPIASGHFFSLIHLDKKEMPEPEEYGGKVQSIRNRIGKEKQSQYSAELLKRLHQKFAVQVDEDLLQQADVNLSGKILNQPLVTTNRENIPFGVLIKDLQQEYRLQRNKQWSEAAKQKMVRALLNGMINDYLITWESLDRKYEERAPFKWSYQFYRENRLIKELERRVIAPQFAVTEEQVVNYYNEHKEEFRYPGQVSYVLLEGDQEAVEKVWREVNFGQDFAYAAKKFDAKVIPYNNMSVNRLHAGLAPIISGLKVGEVGQPYSRKDKFYLVKLIDRKKPEYMSLSSKKGEIARRIGKEKFSEHRNAYLQDLLVQSDISVNEKRWNSLRAELTR
jgi:hypothetical protein